MHVIIHAGAHSTDEGRILNSLFKNRGMLAERGVLLPRPRHYRQLLTATVKALSKRPPGPDSKQAFLDAIMDNDPEQIDRLILHNENFFCVPKIAIKHGALYPLAGERLALLSQLFEGDELELFIGIRNPATFLPATFAGTPHENFIDFMDGADPRDIQWSDSIRSMIEAAPGLRITLWCNEDTPLLWGEILREMTGLMANEPLEGRFDLLAEIMSPEGMERFQSYLGSHPDMPEIQTRRVITAFLEKFAMEEMVEETLDLPGWTDALIEELSDRYEEDLYTMSRLPGVTILAP